MRVAEYVIRFYLGGGMMGFFYLRGLLWCLMDVREERTVCDLDTSRTFSLLCVGFVDGQSFADATFSSITLY